MLKNFVTKWGFVVCAAALFVGQQMAGRVCTGSFYQPKEPIGMEKFSKN